MQHKTTAFVQSKRVISNDPSRYRLRLEVVTNATVHCDEKKTQWIAIPNF